MHRYSRTNKSGSSLLFTVCTCLVEWSEVTPEVKMKPWSILKLSVLPSPSKSCHIQAFVNRAGSSDRVKASRLETCGRDTGMITFAPDHHDLDQAWQSLTKLDKAWQRTGPPICQSRRHQSSGAKSSCIDHIRWYPVVAVEKTVAYSFACYTCSLIFVQVPASDMQIWQIQWYSIPCSWLVDVANSIWKGSSNRMDGWFSRASESGTKCQRVTCPNVKLHIRSKIPFSLFIWDHFLCHKLRLLIHPNHTTSYTCYHLQNLTWG